MNGFSCLKEKPEWIKQMQQEYVDKIVPEERINSFMEIGILEKIEVESCRLRNSLVRMHFAIHTKKAKTLPRKKKKAFKKKWSLK